MKKGTKLPYLISASMLLVLASCDGGNQPSLTSESSLDLGTSEPETSITNSDASVQGSTLIESSATAESSGRGTYNTSVLENAFNESMKKNGMRMVTSQPKLQLGLSSYTVLGTEPNFNLVKGSTNNVVLQADSQTLEMTKNSLLGLTGMRYNCNNISLVAGALSLAGAAFPATSLINQDANLYYKDNTLYWDFLDENGQECTGLSGLMDLAFEAMMSASGETSDIDFQHKGKYELDTETASLLSVLTSSMVTSMLWSSGIDPMIQSLWKGGADITVTQSRQLNETVYDMSIKTFDPSALFGSASDLTSSGVGSLVGGLTDSLPVDVSSATDDLDEDYFSSFLYELRFSYTVNSLRSMAMILSATTDSTKVEEGILDDENLEAGQTKMGLESIQMSQSTVFTFDNSLTIAYPSFNDYVTQEFPVEEEPIVEPISSEPVGSEPTASEPAASEPTTSEPLGSE